MENIFLTYVPCTSPSPPSNQKYFSWFHTVNLHVLPLIPIQSDMLSSAILRLMFNTISHDQHTQTAFSFHIATSKYYQYSENIYSTYTETKNACSVMIYILHN
jgi:hypothetical protein